MLELSLQSGRGLLTNTPVSFPKWALHLLEGEKELHRARDGPHPAGGVALGIFKVLVSQGGQVTYPEVWVSNGRRGSSPLQPSFGFMAGASAPHLRLPLGESSCGSKCGRWEGDVCWQDAPL